MPRALVIRTHGDPEIGRAITEALESRNNREDYIRSVEMELKRLQAQIGVSAPRLMKEGQDRIADLHKRIPIREHSDRYNKIWGYIGLIWLLLTGETELQPEYKWMRRKEYNVGL